MKLEPSTGQEGREREVRGLWVPPRGKCPSYIPLSEWVAQAGSGWGSVMDYCPGVGED